MKRASFTVNLKNGQSFDANHLSIERKQGEDGKQKSILSFICSGLRESVDSWEIKDITFSPESATWCSECDKSIENVW